MAVKSNAVEIVKMHLITYLGANNVLGVKRVTDGYEVLIPQDFSRGYFARAGINANNLRRDDHNGSSVHTIEVPDNCLPAKLAKDAEFFHFLDKAGIIDGVLDVYRTTDGNVTTGYVLEVSDTYSRQNLAQVGIKLAAIKRDAPETGPHHITIPMSEAARILAPVQGQTAANTGGRSWVEATQDAARNPTTVRTPD